MKNKWTVLHTTTGNAVESCNTKREAYELLDFRNTLCYALNIKSKNLYQVVLTSE